MRRTSPCTRIIGGSPEDKCRSDALFFTTKASNSVRSITILPSSGEVFFFACSTHYGNNRRQPASCAGTPGALAGSDFVGSLQRPAARARPSGGCRRTNGVRRELRAGSRAKNGSAAPHGVAAGVAFDRPAPEQQDARGRRALRLGANCGE